MCSTRKEAKPTVAVSTAQATGDGAKYSTTCAGAAYKKNSWSRRDVLHDRCRCRVYCWCWRENFLLVAVVMRLAFTPFCISVERLELNICVCRRLVCESCNKPIAVSPRAVARSKATWLKTPNTSHTAHGSSPSSPLPSRSSPQHPPIIDRRTHEFSSASGHSCLLRLLLLLLLLLLLVLLLLLLLLALLLLLVLLL